MTRLPVPERRPATESEVARGRLIRASKSHGDLELPLDVRGGMPISDALAWLRADRR